MSQVVVEAGILYVTGELDFHNLMPVYAAGMTHLTANKTCHCDLSRLKKSNSAIFALIIAWLRFANTTQKTLVFTGLCREWQTILHETGCELSFLRER